MFLIQKKYTKEYNNKISIKYFCLFLFPIKIRTTFCVKNISASKLYNNLRFFAIQ